MFCQRDFPFPTWLKVSQGAHPAAKPSAGLQYSHTPLILRAARQMLQQGAGRAPTCREDGARFQQPDAEGNGPQRDSDKMQGPGNLFSVQAGRENWGGSEGSPKKGMSRTSCDLPYAVFGGRSGSAACFHKSCP